MVFNHFDMQNCYTFLNDDDTDSCNVEDRTIVGSVTFEDG